MAITDSSVKAKGYGVGPIRTPVLSQWLGGSGRAHLSVQRGVRLPRTLLDPVERVYEYTPSPADPKAPLSRALHKLGVGAGMKFPTSPKTKRGAV